MNILQINKFFFINGGSEQCMFSLIDLLERNNHQVMNFSMKHPKNFNSPYEDYFVNTIDFNSDVSGILNRVGAALKTLYSIEAKKKITALLDTGVPDIAHIHNFNYQLTPSILSPLKRKGVPVVQSLHDYHLICPSHNLYDFNRMEICEDCCEGRFFSAVARRCIKGSRLKSMLGAFEGYLAGFLNTYDDKIDRFISPSVFLKNKVVEYGVAPEKVAVIPNFVDPGRFEPRYQPGNYFVYFGRLEKFKGVETMVQTFKRMDRVTLYILGTGSLKKVLETEIRREKITNVQLLGFKSGKELAQIIQNSMCTIIPSEWYENNPLSVIESFAMGKPVIGSKIGGIPELVKEGETGFLFEPGDTQALFEKLNMCISLKKDEIAQMGRNARELLEKKFTPDQHYRRTMDVYEEMM